MKPGKIILILSALIISCAIPVSSNTVGKPQYRFYTRSQALKKLETAEKTDTFPYKSADEIISEMTPFHFNDSVPFLPMGLLIYSAPVIDTSQSLQFDTCFSLQPKRESVLTEMTKTPGWLKEAQGRWLTSSLLRQHLMTGPLHHVDFFAWQLPEPPQLQPITEAPILPVLNTIPDNLPVMPESAEIPIGKRFWLHSTNIGLQFSQAYISPNWYQGGDNSLTILANMGWNVKLNQVYHPNILLESILQYKLGLYSTPNDEMHKYAISQDLLQYNLTAGLKAFNHWYYSFSTQFKTQILNNYAANSWTRKASFLSPGELNIGLGMTYNNENKKKGITFQASIAPLSYNLRTCIDHRIDPTLFSIKAGHRSVSNIGSNAEINMTWKLAQNITWKQRLFLFSDYDYFTGDWEHTFNFTINKFLSTQVYLHGRYDTSAPGEKKGWKKWMLKEILSFGFAYSFTTVPPKQ